MSDSEPFEDDDANIIAEARNFNLEKKKPLEFDINEMNWTKREKKLFLRTVFNSLKSLKNFHNIFSIIKPKQFDENLREELIKQFNHFAVQISSISNQDLKETLISYLDFLGRKNEEKKKTYDDFIDTLEECINNSTELIDRMIFILDNIEIDETLKNEIVNYIVESKKSYPKMIFEIVKKIRNPKNQKIFFSSMRQFVIDREDFFDDATNQKFPLLSLIIKENYFNKDKEYFNSGYFIKTMERLSEIKDILLNKKFNLTESIGILREKRYFITKLKLILVNENEKEEMAESIYDSIVGPAKELKNFFDLAQNVLHYFQSFFPKSKQEEIGHLKYLVSRLGTIEAGQLENSKVSIINKKIEDFKDYSSDATKYNHLLESNVFKRFLEYEEEKDETNEVSEEKKKKNAEMNFSSMKDLLSVKTFSNLDETLLEERESIFEIFLESFSNKEELVNELNFIKEYFNSNEDITESIEVIMLMFNINNYVSYIEGIKMFITLFNVKQGNYYKNLIEREEFIKEKRTNLTDIRRIVENSLKSLEIDLEKDRLFLSILDGVYKKGDLLEFLLKKKEEDVRRLIEFIDEVENSFLTPRDIQDLINCVAFIEELKKRVESKHLDDKSFISCMKKMISQEEKYKNIPSYFENVCKNYSSLNSLFMSHVHKDEYSKQELKGLFKYCVFIIEKDSRKKKEFQCTIQGNKKQYKFEVVEDFKNRASLKTKEEFKDPNTPDASLTKEDSSQEEFAKGIEKFSIIFSQIQNLIDIMERCVNAGYPKAFHYEIEVNNNCAKVKEENKTLEELLNELKKNYAEMKEKTIESYRDDINMTFIYGKNFYYLDNYLRGNKVLDISSYFYSFSKVDINKLQKPNYQEQGDIFSSMFTNAKAFMLEVSKQNSISKILAPSKINIEEKKKLEGVYLSLVEDKKMEKRIISVYKNYTGNLPINQTILFCNEKTSLESFIAFIYRALTCQENILFSVIKPENLRNELYDEIVQTLLAYFSVKKEDLMKSTLAFFYSASDNDLILQIRRQISSKILEFDKEDEEKIKVNFITVVSSNSSGIGKSHFIQKVAKKNNFSYVFFPVGGDFTKENILERLKLIDTSPSKILLHLDLLETRKKNLMRDFLFSILILDMYSQNEEVYSLDINKFKIYVELPFGNVNFLEVYPFLRMFSEIYIKEMEKIEAGNDITSDIQVVANYFKYKDEINKKNLFFEGLKNIYGNEIEKFKEEGKRYLQVDLIPEDEINQLIDTNFSKEQGKKGTFYQKMSFIKILGNQLKMVTANPNLLSKRLSDAARQFKEPKLSEIRKFILEAFIDITQFFIKGAYSNIVDTQSETYNFYYNYDAEKEIREKLMNLANQKVQTISFKNIKPTLLFVNEDEFSISIISNCQRDTEEYNQFKALFNTDKFSKKDFVELCNYNMLNQEGFLEQIKRVVNLSSVKIKDKRMKGIDFLKDITQNYAFTSDNFIKMILIILRVRAKIPVIMMGETGCGKTFLINMLSKIRRNEMITLNIHSGVTEKKIIKFFRENDLIETNKEKKKKEEPQKWVFLDEINTCNSIGLISEIMCQHTIQGKPIKSNVILIAACNPYRVYAENKKREVFGLVKNKRAERTLDLVYTVNPLPHSLLNYVFDFGEVDPTDEEKYIKTMINDAFKSTLRGSSEAEIDEMKKIANDAISKCQNFIRRKYDHSSISLRDIRRFIIFFKWFFEYYKKKEATRRENLFGSTVTMSIFTTSNKHKNLRCIILSIYMCYYLRLNKKEERKELEGELNKIFKKEFLYYPEKEQKYLLKSISLKEGIAPNSALKENLFALFVCVNTRVPLFICGKPGCSKSLSVQLLFDAMKGPSSDKYLFKQLPRLFINSYQGSETSTSKGIKKVFKKAEEIAKSNNAEKDGIVIDESLISMIYFDEMGLAEISPNNPLKVIHSELEYDEKKLKVAFVGISNYALDASKMNRGIFLSVPPPEKDDLKETGLNIGRSIKKNLSQDDVVLIEALAETYFTYKDSLRKSNRIEQEFHGSRDFYHLIRNCMKDISKKKYNHVNAAVRALEKNFGGLEEAFDKSTSVKAIKKIFNNTYHSGLQKLSEISDYKVLNVIRENLKEVDTRYLMIIAKASISPFLVKSILEEQKRNYNFFIGSQFPDDKHIESYGVKLLNKIQMTMEQGDVLILNQLNAIYPSLYDLFNQNFTIVGGKSFARLALGSTNNLLSEVNPKFRAVVLLDQEDIKVQDPPFLNRFEKHTVSFKDLLSDNDNSGYLDKASEISKILDNLIVPNEANFKPKVDFRTQLLNCDTEEINGIIYKLKVEGIGENQIHEHIFEKIAPTFSQDIIAFSRYSKQYAISKEVYEMIVKYYNKYDHRSLYHYLEKVENSKHLIYSFSTSYEVPNFKDGIQNAKFGTIKKENITSVFVGVISNENMLESIIEDFYKKEDLKLLLLRFNPGDTIHLNHIAYFIENFEKTTPIKYKNKIIVFIVSVVRFKGKGKVENPKKQAKNPYNVATEEGIEKIKNIQNKNLISHLSSYSQVFVDNLNGDPNKLTDMTKKTNEEIMKEHFNIDVEIKNKIYPCLSKLVYTIINDDNSDPEFSQKYVEQISGKIYDNKELLAILVEAIIKILNPGESLFKTIFNRAIFENSDFDFLSLLKLYEGIVVEEILLRIFVYSELGSTLSSVVNSDVDQKIKHELFRNFIQTEIITKKVKIKNSQDKNEVRIILGMKIPSSKFILNYFIESSSFKEKMVESHKIETDFREKDPSDEDIYEEDKESYKEEESKILDLLKMNLKAEAEFFITQIENGTYSQELVELFILDYFKTYLAKVNIFTNYDKLEKLLKAICLVKLNKERFEVDDIAPVIVFIENHSNLICLLCSSLVEVNKYFSQEDDIEQKIEEIITDQQAEEPDSRLTPYERYLNEPFHKSLNCIIKIMISKNCQNDDDNLYYQYFKGLTIVSENATTLEYNLNLMSYHLQTLKQLILVCDSLKDGEQAKDLEQTYYGCLCSEEESIRNNDEDAINEALQMQFDFIRKNIKGGINPYKIFAETAFHKYIQNYSNDYRKILIKFILKDSDYIKNSKKLIYLILYGIIVFPEIDENDENYENDLLSFVENDDETFVLLNESKNKVLDEIILYYCDIKNIEFFREHDPFSENKRDTFLEYLKKALEFIENGIYNEYSLGHIGFLFCISFIKYYSKVFVNSLLNETTKMGNIESITTAFIGGSTGKFRNSVLLYLMKLIRGSCKTIEEFRVLDWEKLQMDFIYGLSCNFEEEQTKDTILFFSPDYLDQYLEVTDSYKKIATKNQDIGFKNYINDKKKAIIVYDIVINNLLYKQNSKDRAKLFSNPKLVQDINVYVDKSINDSNLESKMKEMLCYSLIKLSWKDQLGGFGEIPEKDFDMMLWANKFLLACGAGIENGFYRTMISRNVLNELNNLYVIGGEKEKEDLLVRVFPRLKEYLEVKNSIFQGAYICSCGYYYEIIPCGMPIFEFDCPSCGQKIGGGKGVLNGKKYEHLLVEREGHCRVFLNEEQRTKLSKNRIWCPMSNKLLEEVQKIVEEKKAKVTPGLKKIDSEFSPQQSIREMSPFSYYLLSFILYSCLNFCFLSEYFEKKDIEKYLPQSRRINWNCLTVMKKTWDMMVKILKIRKIEDINIFLNCLFPTISNLIMKCEKPTSEEKRQTIEKEFNQAIEEHIKDYSAKLLNYKEKRKILLNSKSSSFVSILEEEFLPDSIDQEKYQHIQYFYTCNYPSKKEFFDEIQSIPDWKKKYPLLSLYEQETPANNLENLIKINPFANKMLEKYSYRVSRKDARNISIKEAIDDDEELEKLYTDFENGYREFKPDVLKYECGSEMNKKPVNQDSKIFFALCDNNELYGGMVLAAMYKEFISVQNEFLNIVLSSYNRTAKYFENQIRSECNVQNATKDEILSLKFKKEEPVRPYSNIESMINVFSHRDCYREGVNKGANDNGANYIDYNKYKNVTYDFDEIEKELSKNILPGKRLFSSNLKFVTYSYEAYSGEKSAVLQMYSNRYPQKDLSEREKGHISQFFERHGNYIRIMSSLQLLIFYLHKESFPKDQSINSIIHNLPQYISLEQSLIDFFKDREEFTLETLLQLFEYIEFLSYETIKKDIDDKFKTKIPDDIRKRIDQFFSSQTIIKKDVLAKAVRKFSSRFLAAGSNPFQESDNLFEFISAKEDLWDSETFQNEEFMEQLNNINVFTIYMKYAIDFYDVLGGEKTTQKKKITKKEVRQIKRPIKRNHFT